MAEKYYAWNPYNYGFNNPVKNIDPNGMDAIPLNTSTGGTTYQGYAEVGGLGTTEGTMTTTTTISYSINGVETYSYSTTTTTKIGGYSYNTDIGNDWQPFYKENLKDYAATGQGTISCNPCSENQLGDLFESTFGEAMIGENSALLIALRFHKNGIVYPGIRNTQPDYIADAFYGVDCKLKRMFEGQWFEVKQKDSWIYPSTDDGQLAGHVLNLAAARASYILQGFKPILFLITTSDVPYSKSLGNLAEKNHVNFQHHAALFRINNYGFYEFNFGGDSIRGNNFPQFWQSIIGFPNPPKR